MEEGIDMHLASGVERLNHMGRVRDMRVDRSRNGLKVQDVPDGEPSETPVPCDECGGFGYHRGKDNPVEDPCEACEGKGYPGISPFDPLPTNRIDRVPHLQVRYWAGVDLWNPEGAEE